MNQQIVTKCLVLFAALFLFDLVLSYFNDIPFNISVLGIALKIAITAAYGFMLYNRAVKS